MRQSQEASHGEQSHWHAPVKSSWAAARGSPEKLSQLCTLVKDGWEDTCGLPRELSQLCTLVKNWREKGSELQLDGQHWSPEVPSGEEWGRKPGGNARPSREAPTGPEASQSSEVIHWGESRP